VEDVRAVAGGDLRVRGDGVEERHGPIFLQVLRSRDLGTFGTCGRMAALRTVENKNQRSVQSRSKP
jgi:hypothetical protein